MRVHLIAVAGTGMGSLAGLLQSAGHQVSGSDVAFYPPMGPALRDWGITLMEGFDASHLEPEPDLVVVGNVCRRDNPEARAAIDGGMKVTHMCQALAEQILPGTSPLVVAGTHGKTTTSSLAAWILDSASRDPGFLIGGIPRGFGKGFRLPPRSRLPLAGSPRRTPFVIEGDEYDTAFFEKTPKFWHYRPEVAIVTSIEHDHVDIYPDAGSYRAAFAGFLERVPDDGLVVAYAGDPEVVTLVGQHARCPVAWYALDGEDTHGMPPHWLTVPGPVDERGQSFDLFAGGVAAGRGALALSGRHNLRNATAALAACVQGFAVRIEEARAALATFEGIARRQELRGEVGGVRVYDDFAHHPTAVAETLTSLRRRHPHGRLWAVYEPRTATACRKLHEARYLEAFDPADRVLFPPLGRATIDEDERLDLDALVAGLERREVSAERLPSIEAIIDRLVAQVAPGDTVALLSNGAFGGIHERLLEALERTRG